MSKKTWSQKSYFGYYHDKGGWRWRNKVGGFIKWKDLPFEEVPVREAGWLSIDDVKSSLNSLHEKIYIATTSVIKGWFPQGFPYDLINGAPMVHQRNLEIVIQAFMNRLTLELPPEVDLVDDVPPEDTVSIEETDTVHVVQTPEHASREEKDELMLHMLFQLRAQLDQMDARIRDIYSLLYKRGFAQQYLPVDWKKQEVNDVE